MSATVLHGDCRTLMAGMDEASIDSIVTDPPYGLSDEPDIAEVLTCWLAGKDYEHRSAGFMGKKWDSFVPGPNTWKEAYRVLKPGGHLVAFFSTRTYDIGTIALRLAGFEVRDMIDWIYGSGFPKSGILKPGHEPIAVARKPFRGSRISCIAEHGTGGLNIDACRVVTDEKLRAGAGIIPMRHDEAVPRGRSGEASANARYADRGGTDFAATPGSRGGDPAGRYPANVVHDGSDEVLAEFPHTVSGHLPATTPRGATGGPNGKYGVRAAITGPEYAGNSGSAARFFYCAKASKSDRDEGLGHLDEQKIVTFQTGNGASGSASSISEGRETQYRNTHPTVKPTALMQWLCRLITPPSGTILDPFTGSGSTGKAAVLEGFNFIGCEMTVEYLPIAHARIAAAEASMVAEAAKAISQQSQGSLFGAAA